MELRDFSIFEKSPWLAGGPERLGLARVVPTMMSHEEQMLLHWLTSKWADDQGAIVDLGCFVGGSTARLAAGHADAGLTQPIHGYDQFGAKENLKRELIYPAGVAEFEGEDILPVAQRFLDPWKDAVTLHKGLIQEKEWDGSPIEILVMDASKNTLAFDKMADIFYRALVPGAIVVQRGFLHWREPWVAAQMHLMRGWFRPIGHATDETVVFACVAPITDATIIAGRTDTLSDAELLDALEGARVTYEEFGCTDKLDETIAAVKASPDVRTAWKMKWPEASESE